MKFLKELKNEFVLNKIDLIIYLCISLGAFILGELLTVIILQTSKDTDTYFSMGTFIGIIALLFGTLFFSSSSMLVSFDIRVKMGKNRMRSFLTIAAAQAVFVIAVFILSAILFPALDNLLYSNFYSHLPLDSDMPNLAFPWWCAFIVPLLIPVSSLFAFLMQRFGKAVFWVVWVVWMIGCFAPQALNHSGENSIAGKILSAVGEFFKNIPGYGYIIICAAVVTGCIIGDIILIKRYNVKA